MNSRNIPGSARDSIEPARGIIASPSQNNVDHAKHIAPSVNHTPSTAENAIETHPLAPFLPRNARLLMLGSFPPPLARWSMEFYYPNFQNDMWRIVGLVFFGDKNHFLLDIDTGDLGEDATGKKRGARRFDKEKIESFLSGKGIALSDTALKVRRLKGNASDQFLEIVEKTDLAAMLDEIPDCRAIMTAGEKATSTLLSITGSTLPPVGGFTEFYYASRHMRHYRMPSSSRAYPKPLLEKAEVYAGMFRELGML